MQAKGLEEPESLGSARLYSLYVLGKYFNLYGDEYYHEAIERAELQGDEALAYELRLMVSVGLPESNTGVPSLDVSGSSFGEFAVKFINQLDEWVSGLVGD